MTLEEHEPNREFVGRNFNAGEIIQLVLHPLSSKERWLPFKYVQMVMMHELAHCKEMNHGRNFWKVRNEYAGDMRGLWAKGYTGDGMWGRGQTLYSGQYADTETPDASELPETLCGGTYRRRGRKRKRGGNAQLTHAERKQKWIEKKFGKEGQGLGADEMMRRHLEKGKINEATPRVAKSKRGRDLRAEAAALRLRKEKLEQAEREAEEAIQKEDDDGTVEGEETEGTTEDEEGGESGVDDMVKVCGDEGESGEDAQNEMAELSQIGALPVPPSKPRTSKGKKRQERRNEEDISTTEDEGEDDAPHQLKDIAPAEFTRLDEPPRPKPRLRPTSFSQAPPVLSSRSDGGVYEIGGPSKQPSETSKPSSDQKLQNFTILVSADYLTTTSHLSSSETSPSEAPTLRLRPAEPQVCPICTCANTPEALTCLACAHVLNTGKLIHHWRCVSEVCQGSEYVNSEDVARCGLCGAQRE